ncbi:MAG: glycosyltransferase family 2 protein [Thermoanaerobaculales bacterium]
MRTALVIPSLGAPHLRHCLRGVAALDPAPEMKVLVLSDDAVEPEETGDLEIIHNRRRLGFAAAVNTGLTVVPAGIGAVAVLNDDAIPEPSWLGRLTSTLGADPKLAAVQGTIADAAGERVDGRGIGFDRWGLPIQVDRATPIGHDEGSRSIVAVSGTACLYRMEALRRSALPGGEIFDPGFGCYHEDLDLGLRLARLGWSAGWIGGAPVRHLGSASGPVLRWRHPWWLLANRWRALAGNLDRATLVLELPHLLRGEVRAVRTLLRHNPRALPVEAAVALCLPFLAIGGWMRRTPGPRLTAIPGSPA